MLDQPVVELSLLLQSVCVLFGLNNLGKNLARGLLRELLQIFDTVVYFEAFLSHALGARFE